MKHYDCPKCDFSSSTQMMLDRHFEDTNHDVEQEPKAERPAETPAVAESGELPPLEPTAEDIEVAEGLLTAADQENWCDPEEAFAKGLACRERQLRDERAKVARLEKEIVAANNRTDNKKKKITRLLQEKHYVEKELAQSRQREQELQDRVGGLEEAETALAAANRRAEELERALQAALANLGETARLIVEAREEAFNEGVEAAASNTEHCVYLKGGGSRSYAEAKAFAEDIRNLKRTTQPEQTR